MYTGPSIGKSYPLTLEAIRTTTPEEGQAGKIELAEVVDPALKKFVEDPDLLRIPDDKLVDPRTFASVQVAGQDGSILFPTSSKPACLSERWRQRR